MLRNSTIVTMLIKVLFSKIIDFFSPENAQQKFDYRYSLLFGLFHTVQREQNLKMTMYSKMKNYQKSTTELTTHQLHPGPKFISLIKYVSHK